MLSQRLASVRQRLHQACRRSGRSPSDVTLVCVTKGVEVERIREAIAAGATDLGENRVQETRQKRDVLAAAVRWHLVGHLQRNKATHAVELFDVIHSADSAALLDTLERQAAARGRTVDVLIQVNVSGETTKSGCRPEEAQALARVALHAAHLKWVGLMTMAPLSDNPEDARPSFRRLRELRDELAATFRRPAASLGLSMGMSGDFEVAIEEGATCVRIGTAIFGTGDRGHGTTA